MMTTQKLLERIEAHCKEAKVAESTFGLQAVNDGKLVARLRSGKSVTLRTLDKIENVLAGASVKQSASNEATV